MMDVPSAVPRTMRAMVLTGHGLPLQLRDVAVPRVTPTGVLVRVRACGVGLTVVKALASRTYPVPRIVGHEIAGDVVDVGQEVRYVAPGERVTCHFYLTCGQCPNCRMGRETLCERAGGLVGRAIDGGYAEYVLLPERNVVGIPEGVAYVDAAIGADAIATPYHACREARVRPGDDVLVIGAGGGVGIHMLQMVRLYGGRALAVDITDDRLELCRELNADEIIDGRGGDAGDRARSLTDGRGVDAVIDMVASRETLTHGLRALGVGGRWVLVGSQPKSDLGGADTLLDVDPADIQAKALELHSSRYVNLAEIARALRLLRRGRIKAVVTRTFPLEGVEEAHELIRRNAGAGRFAIVFD